MDEERKLTYKFLQLPQFTQFNILKDLKVLWKNDKIWGHDDWMNTMSKIWKRLKKKDKLKDLWWKLNKDLPNYKQLQNPFEK